MAPSEGQRARDICNSYKFRGSMWRGKTMDELTDQECIDMLKYIAEVTGVHYVRMFDGAGN